jgi:hypothetical protein
VPWCCTPPTVCFTRMLPLPKLARGLGRHDGLLIVVWQNASRNFGVLSSVISRRPPLAAALFISPTSVASGGSNRVRSAHSSDVESADSFHVVAPMGATSSPARIAGVVVQPVRARASPGGTLSVSPWPHRVARQLETVLPLLDSRARKSPSSPHRGTSRFSIR